MTTIVINLPRFGATKLTKGMASRVQLVRAHHPDAAVLVRFDPSPKLAAVTVAGSLTNDECEAIRRVVVRIMDGKPAVDTNAEAFARVFGRRK